MYVKVPGIGGRKMPRKITRRSFINSAAAAGAAATSLVTAKSYSGIMGAEILHSFSSSYANRFGDYTCI